MKDYIAKAFKLAKTAREQHEDEISEAYKYTRPNRDIYRADNDKTDRTKIYDSTAPDSVQNLVSTILNLLIPQNSQWATISVREDIKESVASDVKMALDVANRTVFKTIRDSNFYVAASEALTDCIIAGYGCIATYEDKKINFTAIPSYQLYFLDNAKTEIDTVFRQHTLTGQYLLETYGPEKLGFELCKICTEDPYKRHPVLESCFRIPLEDEYTYTVQVGKDGAIMETRKMPVPMFTVFRFNKTVGDILGESPIRMALPHIRVVNEAQQLFMQASAFLAFGCWQTSSDTSVNFSNMKLRPGDVVVTDSPLTPVPFPGSLNITEATIADHRTQIRKMLYNDAILPPEESKYQTATEVQLRQSNFFRRIGPAGLRLENEFLRQVVGNLIVRLQMRGEIQEFIIDGNQFELVVNSAVKKGIAMSEINRDMGILQLINQLGPEASINVDIQKLTRKVIRDSDFSPEAVRSLKEVKAIKEQQQQQAQQQAMMAMAQEAMTQQAEQPQQPQTPPAQ
ncbi:hypothetical protein CMI47_07360 [Candidatus Pacearchaeota archaeon]|jgi:hypothetical protein|nr:hypothetical protein [Candidatus Pacearchaeota archaeon]|tara:strand:+ start:495 stop:2030 length:1536 start_codon:yes stop_codon:yes gene_type:complete